MCGRYTATDELSEFGNRIKFKPVQLAFTRRYNISPSQLAPVVVSVDGERVPKLMRWGLIPSWAKDEKIGYKTINARADSVADKPSYRSAFKKRRCLVLADGFYEWKATGTVKVPHWFTLKNKEPFAFAGLWEHWKNPAGEDVESFTIITTEPNELAEEVHDRMPVILQSQFYDEWLNPEVNDKEKLQAMLVSYPADKMEVRPVSTLVNSPKNDSPKCIEKVE